jgi:hypothetical protein
MTSIIRSKEFILITGYIVGGLMMWAGNYLRCSDASIKGVSMCYPTTGCIVSLMGCAVMITTAGETSTYFVK